MNRNVLAKLNQDKYFRLALMALQNIDERNRVHIQGFFEHEFGIASDEINQIIVDCNRKLKEWEMTLPKCCDNSQFINEVCANCGTTAIDIPGRWQLTNCNPGPFHFACGEMGGNSKESCQYAKKYVCPYPDR